MSLKVSSKAIFHHRYVGLAAVTLALLTVAACSKGNVQAAPAMPPPLVTVASATAQDVPKYLDEIGRNTAFEAVTITPQVADASPSAIFRMAKTCGRDSCCS